MKIFKRNLKVMSNGRQGFTLIELLVVIAIICILSSVVLASLNSARKKARDARRLVDIKQVQTALDLYFDANNSEYPSGGVYSVALASLVSGGFIPVLPSDPLVGGQAYQYCANSDTDATSYNLAATLEENPNPAFSSDADINVASCVDTTPGDTFDGTTDATNRVYDVKP